MENNFEKTGAPLKIALIEDDASIVDIYQIAFKKERFEVLVYSSGQEAMRAIKEWSVNPSDKPNLFLLDFILPDITGADILSEIRNNSETKDSTVFIFSNENNIESLLPTNIKPDKILVKADTTPTQLIAIIKDYFKI